MAIHFNTTTALCTALLLAAPMTEAFAQAETYDQRLLTDPFLQLPTADGVHVVWFTEYAGANHRVVFGEGFDGEVMATTSQMSRLAEDEGSWVGEQMGDGTAYAEYTPRPIWRHEAHVTGLTAGERVPYYVVSETDAGDVVESRAFSLAPLPAEGQPLRILLTSDHQLKEMTPANMQMVHDTIGQVDAVFFAGDLQNIPDRASEWFDDNRGFAFFPGLQGLADHTLVRTRTEDGIDIQTTVTYRGAEIIQNAPLFPVIGNHEVMGRFNPANGLGGMFNDPRPTAVAEALYEANSELYNPSGDPAVRAAWIADNSFNTLTYEELFTLPEDGPEGERFYSMAFGDIFMIGTYGTRIWRSPSMAPGTRGKFRESAADLDTPDDWGWGEFIFEDMARGSAQNDWIADVLGSEAYTDAAYRVVLMHQPVHGLGDNSIPGFVHPQQILDRDEDGRLVGVRYDYPLADDVFVNDVEPMLSDAGVDLVHTGHSHVWYRFQNEAGVNFMETSNVGNNYGCYLEGYSERAGAPADDRFDSANYPLTGDPHGYEPIMPTEFAPMQNEAGEDLPCVASNTLTSFSILETGPDGATVSSYIFDTTQPEGDVRLFDRYTLD